MSTFLKVFVKCSIYSIHDALSSFKLYRSNDFSQASPIVKLQYIHLWMLSYPSVPLVPTLFPGAVVTALYVITELPINAARSNVSLPFEPAQYLSTRKHIVFGSVDI